MSLDFASTGVYGDDQLAHVTPARLERFFTRRSSGYQISADLRQLIVFARHNVLKDAPFTKMSFISCRNMLIYPQPQAQRTVLSLFHFGLASGGILFMGASESPGALSDEFTPIDDHWKIYRKRRDVQLLAQLRLPLGRRNVRGTPVPIDLPRTSAADPLILATYDQLLDQFMPPSLLIDEDRCLIDSFGGAERILRVRRRRMSTSILDLLEGELRTVIAGAIQRAIKEQTRVDYTGVRIPDGDGERRCTMSIRPLVHPRTGARHLLVSFGSAPAAAEAAEPSASVSTVSVHSLTVDQVSQERMSALETELAYTKETLQATIEELETSNEEMQATNEELVASNEELQSTNEELHSVNEELYSVNAEYQQKIAELKELNADIQHLLEGTDVGTLFLDRDLRIRRFTPRIASVFHIVEHDVGRQISDFSHNIERRSLMEDIERARRDGAMLEAPVRDRHGTPYFLRILPYRVAAGRDGDAAGRRSDGAPIQGVVLTLTDITALDKARSKLAQLSAIVESCDDAIVGKALDGTVTSWNRGAERLYGYTADEAIGQNVRMLMNAPDGELERYLDMIRRGEKVEHVQSVRVRKDGSRFEVSLTISPIWDHDGELVGVSAIARDVTPLVVAQRELETAARRREQFLAMLSHELRNPLAAVLNATNLMEEARFDGTTVERCHTVIGRQSSHMARLLDDLLDVSRITHGKFELRKQDLDLRGPIEAAIESVAPLVAERKIELRVELLTEAVLVRGDASRLQQVVVNLLSNAIAYSPSGAPVELRLERAADRAHLQVTDRGIGIDPGMLDKIFDLFVQAEQRLDRPRGGLGVGLSLARSVIELHGGTIEAFSDGPDRGSRFVVRLPLQAHAIRGRVERRAPPIRQYRVVVVEDNVDSREMLRVLLEKRQHVVIEAADGAQGVELIEREHPDAALIDIGLPVFSGFEVARQIRGKKHLDDIVLVALTGYGAPSDVAAAREAGFDHHLCKPADLARIEALLGRPDPDRGD
jgi:two-component system CheB/CheR fusion protein